MQRAARTIPYARSAVWTRRLAVSGALLAIAAVVLPRRGADVTTALALLVSGLACAGLAVLCAAVAAVAIWRTGDKGAGRAAAGLCVAALTLAYPAFLTVKLVRDAPATDLSTDPDDPPQFTSPAARIGPVADVSWLLRHGQQTGAVDPITVDRDPLTTYRAALKTVTQLHWRVVSGMAPNARAPLGRIEAVTYSAVMRLPEWISIRIGSRNGQTRVDLRAMAGGPLPLLSDDPLRNIQAFTDMFEEQDAEN